MLLVFRPSLPLHVLPRQWGDGVGREGVEGDRFRTGLDALDDVLPGGGLPLRAVHEVIADPAEGGPPLSFVLLIARAAAAASASASSAASASASARAGVVVWCDAGDSVYPPALSVRGLSPDRLVVVRPPRPADAVWVMAECLRSRAVSVAIAAPQRLTRVEARRLQLAAERGGGVGLLLRTPGPGCRHYAAATRWLVRPAAGDERVQRWVVRLIHGHGGRIGEDVLLEVDRDGGPVRSAEVLAGRSNPTQAAAAGRRA